MSKDKYLDIEQAAAYAGKHPQTIRRWIHDGKLKASLLGRELRVTREDLDAMYQPVHPEQVKTEA